MKTLKERVSDLQNEIEKRIINGDFELVKVGNNRTPGFFNTIYVSIDGIDFSFSVSEDKTYLSQHDGPVKIRWYGYEIGDLKHLYETVEALELELKKEQLKKLEDEIREIQAK